ncbi:hypothetical protein M406DRAFT_356990 [Cryphonectria parasitica EP155]|uniref:C2H2-type domain-containing protein n=1 Tax=Cryphonectria parasitica (strain ATCC 38755 / EP155) TaxID=660469 RepID=A0A9P5CLN2_CRYP1|nr:uncharacterized protein M406DRAFT_356990 [Cryphonectria parasitica EP155]KAF3763263.1 hypothetical protein M406DRAFT_356990 [Cryphonectria parasitica EP155]
MNSWFSQAVVVPTTGTSLTFECGHCHRIVCNETCLAGHRDRYHCHNSRCVYHRPTQPQYAASPVPSQHDNNNAALDSAGTYRTTAEPLPASTTLGETTDMPEEGNLVIHETITREYCREEDPVPINASQHRTSGHADRGSSHRTEHGQEVAASLPPLPVDVTDAEIVAQERLLAEYQRRAHQ